MSGHKVVDGEDEEDVREMLIELNSRAAQALEEYEYQVKDDGGNDLEAVFENLNSVDSLSSELLEVFW